MIIRFTYAQIRPVAKVLQGMKANWCPRDVKPERWAKIKAGKAAHLEFAEFEGIITAMGWAFIEKTIGDNPHLYRTRKKATAVK